MMQIAQDISTVPYSVSGRARRLQPSRGMDGTAYKADRAGEIPLPCQRIIYRFIAPRAYMPHLRTRYTAWYPYQSHQHFPPHRRQECTSLF